MENFNGCNNTQYKQFISKPLFHVAIITLLGLICYANSFNASLVLDDLPEIRDNPIIHSLSDFFRNGAGYDYNPNRYIGYLSFALNYHFNGLQPTGYHVVNFLIHIIASLLIYYLVLFTFRTPILRRSILAPTSNYLALWIALLFVCHPIQTQAVTYVYQRLASMAALFYIATIVLYIQWRLTQIEGGFYSGKALLYWITSLLTAIMAMKTKEVALTLPLVILLYEICFFMVPNLKRLITLMPLLLTGIIIPISSVNLGKSFGSLLTEMNSATVLQSPLSRWEYLLTQFRVIVTYLRLLFFPVNQNLDYDFPINHFFLEPRAFLSFILLAALVATAALFWRHSSRRGDAAFRMVAFGIFWFFITLMIESSIIPITDVIVEHRLYLPSVGFFIAIVTLVMLALKTSSLLKRSAHKLSFLLLIFTVIPFTITTINRNSVWADSLSLWQDSLRKSPMKSRPYNAVGYTLYSMGDFDKAINYYKEAIHLDPDKEKYHINLGTAYFAKGLLDNSIDEYLTALKISPNYLEAHSNLGKVYAHKGLYDKAIRQYNMSLSIDKNNADAHYSLGVAYANTGQLNLATTEFKAALNLKPGDELYSTALAKARRINELKNK